MIAQHIVIGRGKWDLIVYYDVTAQDFSEISEALLSAGCLRSTVRNALNVLRHKNTGLTFSNLTDKLSIVCISAASSKEQFINTAVHEAKHVLSHICQFYNVGEQTEEAAYLIGHVVYKMYKILKLYV